MLKVGDKVRVKSFEYCDDNFQDFNPREMKKYCGKIGIIKEIELCSRYNDRNCNRYYLDISDDSRANAGKGYFWFEDCFEIVNNILEIE